MKKLFTILSIALSMTVMSAPEDLLEKNDYLGFVSQYALTQSNLVTEANYRQIYDAGIAATNLNLQASKIAGLAFLRDWDKSLLSDALSRADKYGDFYMGIHTTVMDGNTARNLTANRADRDGMLQAYRVAYNRGKYEVVALAVIDSFGTAWGMKYNDGFYPGFTEEWRNLCKSALTKENISQFTTPAAVYYAYLFWRHEDALNNDKNQTLLASVWDDDMASIAIRFTPSFWWQDLRLPYDIKILKTTVKYSTNSMWRRVSAIWLKSSLKTDEFVEYVYNDITKKLNWSDRWILVSSLNDDDKYIDTALLIDGDQTPDVLNAIIKKIISFDVDYRAADVNKILRTINAKYTIKLYDDRSTWEPIISKVRALIDARQ